MPGNPDPKKSGKRVQFQISPEKLENGLSTSKSSPGSILILLQYKIKKQLFFRLNFFFFFSNSPLMGVNLFWKFKILKKAFLRPAGLGIRNSPRPEKRLAWPLSLSCSAHMSAPGWMGSRHQETVGWGVLLRDRKDVWGRLPGQMHNKSQGFMYINIQKVYGWGVLPGQIN